MTDEKDKNKVCRICGKQFSSSVYGHINVCGMECHRKLFWLEIIAERDKHIVIDGECYYLDRNNLNGHDRAGFKGFSGKLFRIKFNNGEIIETTNLWYNGKVPEEFRGYLNDEAVFVKKEVGEKVGNI